MLQIENEQEDGCGLNKMARASHIDARAIYCLQAAGGVSVLCLEVFLDPGDGTLGILSEVDVLFALGRQQRDAQRSVSAFISL